MITKFVHGEWHTDHDDDPVQIGDSAGQFVAMTLPCGDSIGTARDYENAAFIVRACNAHDWLVEAVSSAIKLLRADRRHAANRASVDRLLASVDRLLSAALAKAKGEA